MNREIKFRAFDNKNKNFFIPSLSEFSDMNDEIENLTECGRYKLIQYTGLKDKNGKEVYEGDVLLDENGQIYTVEFFNYSFNVVHKDRKLSDIYTLWEYINNIFLCEIIGNIYENPELLESREEKNKESQVKNMKNIAGENCSQ